MKILFSEHDTFIFDKQNYKISKDFANAFHNNFLYVKMYIRCFTTLNAFDKYIESSYDCIVLLKDGHSFTSQKVGEDCYLSIKFFGYKRPFNSLFNFI